MTRLNRVKQAHTPDRTPIIHPLARAIALSLALGGGLAHAATITVDTSADGVLGTFPNDCTLRAAIESANTGTAVDGCIAGSAGLDEIVFDSTLAESTITLAAGQLEITNDLSIIGPVAEDAGGIVIDGNGQSRLLFIEGATASEFAVGLAGMTLTNGRTTNDNETGGGIHVTRADLSLNHAIVSGNSTEGEDAYGGGVYARYGNVEVIDSSISGNSLEPVSTSRSKGAGLYVKDGDLALIDSRIQDNTVVSGNVDTSAGVHMMGDALTVARTTVSGNSNFGGGFNSVGGMFVHSGDLVMTDSEVFGNYTASGTTAGMDVRVTGSASISDSVFSGNMAEIDTNYYLGGGGLSLVGGGTVSANVELTNVEVSDNSMNGGTGSGGGIGISSIQNAVLTNVTITGNTSSGRGGGLFVRDSSVRLISSTISGNTILVSEDYLTRQRGGGIAAYLGGDVTLIDSTVSGNSAASYGGGIHGRGGEGGSSLQLINSTVSGNSTGASGGGIMAGKELSLIHTTVANNTAASGADAIHLVGDQVFFNNSLIIQAEVGETACNAQATSHSNTLATDNSCTGTVTGLTDIALQPLADNGGPTLTHALGAESVAIESAGDCVTDFGISSDQRGIPRPGPGSSACDIGAFEFFIDMVFSDRFEND